MIPLSETSIEKGRKGQAWFPALRALAAGSTFATHLASLCGTRSKHRPGHTTGHHNPFRSRHARLSASSNLLLFSSFWQHAQSSTDMSRYIDTVIVDNPLRDLCYVDDDEIVGYEYRKKPSIASNFLTCLTGKKPKREYYLFPEARPRQDLMLYEQRCYDDDLALMPWGHRPRSRYQSYFHEEMTSAGCPGCIMCLQYPDLGRWHRPGPRPGRGIWHYDYHEHGHGHGLDFCRGSSWDPAPFWDPDWCPPRLRRRYHSRSSRRRDEHPFFTMQREKVKLLTQRLREMRHERIYNEWPKSYSLNNWRQRNDRIEELDGKVEDLQAMQQEYYYGGEEGSDWNFSDSDC